MSGIGVIGALGILAYGEILKHINKSRTKTKTKTQAETATAPSPTPTVSPTPQPHQEYFPVSPFGFHPFGLIANVYPIGASSPIVIKWNIPFTKTSIFEWDYDTKNGSHYHVMLPSMNNSNLEGGHYWPGDAVPEPWNSLFFSNTSSEPTRGIDVGAKYEVYTLINQIAARGAAVVVISSEMNEVIGMSDRIIVMAEGKITGELNRKDATQNKILTLASNLTNNSGKGE